MPFILKKIKFGFDIYRFQLQIKSGEFDQILGLV